MHRHVCYKINVSTFWQQFSESPDPEQSPKRQTHSASCQPRPASDARRSWRALCDRPGSRHSMEQLERAGRLGGTHRVDRWRRDEARPYLLIGTGSDLERVESVERVLGKIQSFHAAKA